MENLKEYIEKRIPEAVEEGGEILTLKVEPGAFRELAVQLRNDFGFDYLVCMTGMLRMVRLQRRKSIWTCAVVMLGSCVCWAFISRVIPWLYATSAIVFWLFAFVVFGIFFVKEVLFIVEMRMEG